MSKILEKVQKSSETGFSECSEFTEISEIVLFRTFRKLQKNDVKLEIRKSQYLKIAKNSFRLENRLYSLVQNAGPYKQESK